MPKDAMPSYMGHIAGVPGGLKAAPGLHSKSASTAAIVTVQKAESTATSARARKLGGQAQPLCDRYDMLKCWRRDLQGIEELMVHANQGTDSSHRRRR